VSVGGATAHFAGLKTRDCHCSALSSIFPSFYLFAQSLPHRPPCHIAWKPSI